MVQSVREVADAALLRMTNELILTTSNASKRVTSCAGYTLRNALRELWHFAQWHAQQFEGVDSELSCAVMRFATVLASVGMYTRPLHIRRSLTFAKAVLAYIQTCTNDGIPKGIVHDERKLGLMLRAVLPCERYKWLETHFEIGTIVADVLVLTSMRQYEELYWKSLWMLSGRQFSLESHEACVRKTPFRPAVATAHVVA